MTRHFMIASDFDQTLSFNDSGLVLSQRLGSTGSRTRCAASPASTSCSRAASSRISFVTTPTFARCGARTWWRWAVRSDSSPTSAGSCGCSRTGIPGYRFSFMVVSAAPQEVVQSALEGIVAPENIFGTRFDYDPETGEIGSLLRVPAGYGKVAVLDDLQARLQVSSDRIVYVGDGSSDVHVMLHVNHRDGFTVAVSETRLVTPIARRTILADDALSVLVPILEDVVGYDRAQVRGFFEANGLVIREWDRVRTDRLSIEAPQEAAAS